MGLTVDPAQANKGRLFYVFSAMIRIEPLRMRFNTLSMSPFRLPLDSLDR